MPSQLVSNHNDLKGASNCSYRCDEELCSDTVEHIDRVALRFERQPFVSTSCQRATHERRCGRQTGSGTGGVSRPKKRTILVAEAKDQECSPWPFFLRYHNDPEKPIAPLAHLAPRYPSLRGRTRSLYLALVYLALVLFASPMIKGVVS